MKITNLGHASFLIEDDEVKVVFDPYKNDSVPGLVFPRNIECNFVFTSHNHLDHNGIELVNIIQTNHKLKSREIVFPHDKQNGQNRGFSIAKVVYFSDYSIAHLGDIGDISNVNLIKKLLGVDIILCPINGYYTISAEEAFKLKQLLPKSLLIPMHHEGRDHSYGYPDNGQINIFKKLFRDIYEVNDTVEMTKDILNHDALIFNSYKQGERV